MSIPRQRSIAVVAAVLMAVNFGWSASANAAVYWTGGSLIGRANNDGGQQNQSFIGVLGSEDLVGPCGVAVDASHIYWAEMGANRISRAGLDGANVIKGFITGADEPCGVAVDSDHLYWTNRGGASIGRARLDGSEADQSFISGIDLPCGVAVTGSSVFWATPSEDTIGHASITGGEIEKSFIKEANGACGVAVDGEHVYWGTFDSSIGRANLDGTEPVSSFIAGLNRPCGVTIHDSHLYWSEEGASGGSVGRANLDGSQATPGFIAGPVAGCGVAVDDMPVPVAIPPQSKVTPSSRASFGWVKYQRRPRKPMTLLAVEVGGPGSYRVKVPRGVGWKVLSGEPAGRFAKGGRKWIGFWIKEGNAGQKLARSARKKGRVRIGLTLRFTEPGHLEAVRKKSLFLLGSRSSG
jgi:hypothetical protein